MQILYLEKIHNILNKFPGITNKNATRIAIFLINNPEIAVKLETELKELKKLAICKNCNNIGVINICKICSDNWRSQKSLFIVSQIQNIYKFEESNLHNGLYYVIDYELDLYNKKSNIDLEKLFKFISEKKISEITVAINPTLNGELTSQYIIKELKKQFKKANIYRLGYGVPIGLEIENIDDFTLRSALKNRKKY